MNTIIPTHLKPIPYPGYADIQITVITVYSTKVSSTQL